MNGVWRCGTAGLPRTRFWSDLSSVPPGDFAPVRESGATFHVHPFSTPRNRGSTAIDRASSPRKKNRLHGGCGHIQAIFADSRKYGGSTTDRRLALMGSLLMSVDVRTALLGLSCSARLTRRGRGLRRRDAGRAAYQQQACPEQQAQGTRGTGKQAHSRLDSKVLHAVSSQRLFGSWSGRCTPRSALRAGCRP